MGRLSLAATTAMWALGLPGLALLLASSYDVKGIQPGAELAKD